MIGKAAGKMSKPLRPSKPPKDKKEKATKAKTAKPAPKPKAEPKPKEKKYPYGKYPTKGLPRAVDLKEIDKPIKDNTFTPKAK